MDSWLPPLLALAVPGEENRAENLTSVCVGLDRKAKGIPVFAGALIYHFSLRSSECTDKPFTAGLWMHLVWEASFYSGKSQICFYSPPPPRFTTRHILQSCNHLDRLWPEHWPDRDLSWNWTMSNDSWIFLFYLYLLFILLVACFLLSWIISTFHPLEKHPLTAVTSCLKEGGAEQKLLLLRGTACYCAQLLIAANKLFQCRFLFLDQWESVIIGEAERPGFVQS